MRQPRRIAVGDSVPTIQQRFGSGAFGVVYKVRDETASIDYALKDVLCCLMLRKLNSQCYFFREVQTMNQISHENVIAVIKADQLRDAQGLHMLILTS